MMPIESQSADNELVSDLASTGTIGGNQEECAHWHITIVAQLTLYFPSSHVLVVCRSDGWQLRKAVGSGRLERFQRG